MTIEPPQPPTAPAPAVRPTPPTPPRIDMTPFDRDKGLGTRDESIDEPVETSESTPEAQARDAVANGAGPLTKRTVNRDDDNQSAPPNQTVTVIPPDAPLVDNGQSDYDKGKDVLRQFRDLDAQESHSTPAQASTEQSATPHVTPKFNYHEGHGGLFWIFTIIFAAVASIILVKKFLLTDKPAQKLKATTDTKSAEPPPKPKPPLKNDGKGKHFEVRV